MNQSTLSFLSKTVCCILIINVTFCSSCFRTMCRAKCYLKNRGFDSGYCEEETCLCVSPVVYVFDGIGRDLSDKYIDNSMVNNNVIQNSIKTSWASASDTSDENKKNKVWKNIVNKIISKNSLIKEEDLKYLKEKIFNNLSDLNKFATDLQNPLKTALNEMKNNNPSTTKECKDLLKLLLQREEKNGASNKNSKNSPILNGASNQLPLQDTTPQIVSTPKIAPSLQATPKTVNKSTAPSPRNIVPNKNDVTNSLPVNSIAGANPNVQQNSNPNRNKLKTKQTPNKEDDKNEEIVFELSDESYEDSNEQFEENIKQNDSAKPHTPNDKTGKNLPAPAKNEKLDDDDLYELVSVSSESSEEDNAKKVVDAVKPTSNK